MCQYMIFIFLSLTYFRNREQTRGKQWEERREKGRCMESITQTFTIPYTKQIANGNLLYDSGNSNRGSETG